MRVIKEFAAGTPFQSEMFDGYFGGLRLVTADIETTGLSRRRNEVILGGIAEAVDGGWNVTQYFAERPREEAELLAQYAEHLGRADAVLTYNGASFDLPFLRQRMKRHGMETAGLEALYSLDLYRILKKYSHLPEILPDLKQKTVERYLGDGDARTDEISGAQSVELYRRSVDSTGREKDRLQSLILLHNRDDVVRLSRLLRLMKQLDLHRIMYEQGFPVHAGEYTICLKKIRMKGRMLNAEGNTGNIGTAFSFYGDGGIIEVDHEGKLRMQLECEPMEDWVVVDLQRLQLDGGSLTKMGGYESGYLILSEPSGHIRYHEVNYFVRALLTKLLQ